MRTTILIITSLRDHTQEAEHCKDWQTYLSKLRRDSVGADFLTSASSDVIFWLASE